ncbi:MAG: hypothetical protein ACLFST_09425 [Spirochaetia bacterium]
MKTKKFFKALIFLAIVLAITGCASVGKGNLNQAKDELKAERPDGALRYASEALVLDPDYDKAKALIKETAEEHLANLEAFLTSSKMSRDLKTVEREFDIYRNLIVFYGNLEEVGQPLVKGKKLFGLIKGWTWSTPIKDYKPNLEVTRVKARKVFLESGYNAIGSGNLDQAEEHLDKVVSKFAVDGSAEQTKDKKDISIQFSNWAANLHGQTLPKPLLAGLKGYNLALKYDKGNKAASDGAAKIKLEISTAYYNLAMTEQSKNTIDTLKESIDLFKTALKYNKENKGATDGIQVSKHKIAVIYTSQGEAAARKGTVDDMIEAHGLYVTALEWDSAYPKAIQNKETITVSIAEYYYQEGNKLAASLTNDNDLKAAVASYKSAQEWIPDYKDTEPRKRRVYVSRQLIILQVKLKTTQAEFDRTNTRIITLSGLVNDGHKGVEDLFYVSDKIIQLDGQMMTIGTVMSPMGSIPYIGPVFSSTGVLLDQVHRPVKAVSGKTKKFQKPYITPSREMIGKVKGRVDQVVDTMDKIKTSLVQISSTTARLNQCMLQVEDPKIISEVEKDVKEINKIMDKLNNGLKKVNKVQDDTEASLKILASSVAIITNVKGGMKKIMDPLDKIDGVTSEIKKVLDKKIKVPFVGTYTVAQAVDSSTGVVKKAAKKLLNPLMDKLNIKFPSIPQIDELEKIVDKVEDYHNDIKSAYDQMNSATDEILAIPDQLKKKTDSIVSKTGCKI